MASIATLAAFDTRLVFGSAWTYQMLDTGGIGGRTIKATAATNSNLDFTPTATGAASASVDTFVVWYVKASSSAKFSWSIDAGGTTVVDTSNATNDIGFTTISNTLGTHTLHLLWNAVGSYASGSNLWILGVQAYDSTQKQIEVWQGGYNSAFVSTMNGAAQPWCVTPMLASLAPDLTVIQLQINDAVVAGTPIAQYKSDLQTLVNTCLATGDVILRTGYPSQVTYNPPYGALSSQKLYRDVIAAVALANDITFDDVWSRMGSYEIQQALPGGAMYAESLHPTGSVYASAASNLAKILRAY